MFKAKILALALSTCAIVPAFAVSTPTPSSKDSRVLYANYDPSNVVQLYGVIGRQTFVKFDNDERVLDLAGGDTSAWEIGVIAAGNGFFIKPKTSLDPNTNITIVTNKRFYNFDLKLTKSRAMYTIVFRYPDQEAKQSNAIRTASRVSGLFAESKGKVRNHNYWLQGPEAMTPIQVWDDGRFTYFKFSPGQDIPAFYYVDDQGNESLAEAHPDGNEVVSIARLEKKFVLRNGDGVACVYNKGWSRYAKFSEYSKTVSPDVQRVIKGAE
ncbi:TrbG/VirB9 family P-type conjugative transfer protein [Salmonella enterica]